MWYQFIAPNPGASVLITIIRSRHFVIPRHFESKEYIVVGRIIWAMVRFFFFNWEANLSIINIKRFYFIEATVSNCSTTLWSTNYCTSVFRIFRFRIIEIRSIFKLKNYRFSNVRRWIDRITYKWGIQIKFQGRIPCLTVPSACKSR